MRALRRTAILGVAAVILLAVPAVPARAEDFPDFWTGPNNGATVTALLHGDAVFPYFVGHPDAAQVECYLRVYEVTGPSWTLVRELPLGTQSAADPAFCGSDLPFSYTWTDVDLEPGGYRCKVAATDGTRWADDDLWCTLNVTTTPDTTPPVTTATHDGLWHNTGTVVYLTVEDDRDGWGVMGGQAGIEYSRDGGSRWAMVRWWTQVAVTYPLRKHGGSGVYTLLFRSTDFAGNVEATQSIDVKIDRVPPQTTDDAPLLAQSSDVVVHLTAADPLCGAVANSGVAATRYRLDDGGWTQGVDVLVKAARNAGAHQIAYYSVDSAGNAERVKVCSVTIAAPVASQRVDGVNRVNGVRHRR